MGVFEGGEGRSALAWLAGKAVLTTVVLRSLESASCMHSSSPKGVSSRNKRK